MDMPDKQRLGNPIQSIQMKLDFGIHIFGISERILSEMFLSEPLGYQNLKN